MDNEIYEDDTDTIDELLARMNDTHFEILKMVQVIYYVTAVLSGFAVAYGLGFFASLIAKATLAT